MRYKYVIVGAGLAGLTFAERAAAAFNRDILIIEKRGYIGGNCHDSYDDYGILVHDHGPHIFHTNHKDVWDYLSSFTDWHYYQHRVMAYIDGRLLPMPIGTETINSLYNLDLSTFDVEEFLHKKAETMDDIRNSEDVVLSKAGRDIYEKFFKNYTKKQWDVYANELDKSVISRVPIKYSRDTRYFTNIYQGVPKHGYTNMCLKMADSPKIHILLNTDYKQVIEDFNFEKLIYTGPVDYFFDYKHGKLKYRGLKFEYETFHRESYQEAAVINYPNDYDFTRITEFKKLTGQVCSDTTIMREYPSWEGEPYYPYPTFECSRQYELYREECLKLDNVIFLGRLAEYKYYDMDGVIKKTLDTFNKQAR